MTAFTLPLLPTAYNPQLIYTEDEILQKKQEVGLVS